MRRRVLLRLLAAPLLVALATAPLWGPRVLQRVDWFDVERVEVSGTRLLAPHEVLAAAGIQPGQSVWDTPAAWEAALRAHPVIADAKILRRLPRTLRIHIEEEQPVALLEAGTLRLATAAGALLPVNPARISVDLPLLRVLPPLAATGEIEAPETRALLAETGRLAQLDPGLLARVSEVKPSGSGELRLLLTQPEIEVLLKHGASSRRLLQLRAALDEIERRRDPGDPRVQLDARFTDQIVVRN